MTLTDLDYVCAVPAHVELPRLVYKYREVNQFLLSSLLLNQVWLAKPETFNDPFEPTRVFSGSSLSEMLAREVSEAGVLCLCKRSDNLPMWAYYGGALKGIAVGYDLANLVRKLEPLAPDSGEEVSVPRWRYVYDMAYSAGERQPIDEEGLLGADHEMPPVLQKMFATKASAFGHEEECRVVVPPSPGSPHAHPEYAWSGHGLYQHAPDAVKEIVFGELVTPQNRLTIMKIMAGRDVAFFNAVREKTRFAISVAPIGQDDVSGSTEVTQA